ncbi:hypothetical protein LEP1GSC032_1455 [Leptospira interrogans str. 2002000631]|nr:hypothetical protein LEP1GSC027_0020 [Leptospira interrogans str. 2002000624]EKQ48803.1 hypothetical protein LEP1GSC026_1267 [Leptospira interrogans str. 2002000623]EMJ71307.1 hypothetical protein LEP1GSC033_1353 [Leptospira interrogans str. 2002000632]EMJ79034.1 hypothetical protein LEP1GSC032_1455 [Leptospira interrogans str. 2002000631]
MKFQSISFRNGYKKQKGFNFANEIKIHLPYSVNFIFL